MHHTLFKCSPIIFQGNGVVVRNLLALNKGSLASCWALEREHWRHYAKGYPKNKLSRYMKNNKPKELDFTIPNYISVSKLANLLNCRIETLMKDLRKLGFSNTTHNYILSKEYVELILQEYNYNLPASSLTLTSANAYDELKSPIDPKLLKKRPPIVTIMGHVDHGKTTIIDYLRKSSVVAQEHGGITQHIGAFKITTPITKKNITFLDTPGHAAFLKMRERGANITDIIVLVISIEDSIMPQTLEAIKHIKKSGNELVVAITKIDMISRKQDREKALDKVMNDLINNDISIEKIGGDVQVVPISAKTGENMDLLEESIVLLSDMMDLRSENSPRTTVEGWVIESKVKKTVGNVATVLIKKGTLRNGTILLSGDTYCKVRSMTDEFGKQASKAEPSQVVEILGWKSLVNAGDEVLQAKTEAIAKKLIAKRAALLEVEKEATFVDKLNEKTAFELKKGKDAEQVKEDDDNDEENIVEKGPKQINFIVKSDVSGSAEAIQESIASLGNDEVKCTVISSTVGLPTEGDYKMAQITNSQIFCFNLGNLPNDIINNKYHIPIKQFNVIYKLIEEVIKTLTDNLKPIFEKKFIGTVDIREIFEFTVKKKIIKIAGCKVRSGVINKNSLVQIVRGPGKEVIYDGKIASLKHGKDDITEATKGHECGITFDNRFEDYKADDSILIYENIKIQRYL
ncbi:translation initiation factor 2 NDAI_0G06010 [Naumovozyma dairenensis CBS 421]|uniref:Translation initiation factor IF-2, mitochondrial n=1 Tax=Naumovozyma dairenensis (strain ATCC 10597 / BCRC 20456 / CBS 421 / NBRC 0211 / NRRL Y-12639) TaxID=1071378 RepID=J7REP1_NAUDC|nr:hypothetical protein NDAI_0G06010 [Naumovozyma dairenensis CBS 421]CCK73584.1 hypothetical protein NDAI_0G06010 [Naumovozyma dairenensis CBS 421]